MATDSKIEIHRDKKTNNTIIEDLERMRGAISRRAYELFQGDGHIFGRELDHWLTAEREMMSAVPIDFYEKDGRFDIRAALPGVDPNDIDVQVTPERLLIKGELKHEHRKEENATVHACEFASGSITRLIEFPKRIDPDKVTAKFSNGMLMLTAALSADEKARNVDVRAA